MNLHANQVDFRVPYSVHRDCMIVIQPQREAYKAVCFDAAPGWRLAAHPFRAVPTGAGRRSRRMTSFA
jgi:hypothetical protein